MTNLLTNADDPEIASLLGMNNAGNRLCGAAAIAAGNSGDRAYLPVLKALMDAPSPGVRESATWAAAQLGKGECH